MKSLLLSLAVASATILPSNAAITVPGADASDGVLNITVDTEIDLSEAVEGDWDLPNGANAGKGVYDPAKWAVVFKYSSVTVAAGKTLTFKNHPSRAPLVWLVSGNVTIAGTVSLNGQNNMNGLELAEPGPGGFRGGSGSSNGGVYASAGFGVGGARVEDSGYGRGGAHGADVPPWATAYGNPSLVPLIGGSGGSGVVSGSGGWSGGGGGGALLIAAASTVSIGGEIRANGGNGNYAAGTGSGGGIRVVCDVLGGAGNIKATPGTADRQGSVGRIRLERFTNSGSLQISPDPSVVPLASGATALLWPPSEAPDVRVVSIGGITAPTDPKASFGSAGADVALPQTATTQVIVETTNVEQASQVQVRLGRRSLTPAEWSAGNRGATVVNATFTQQVTANPLVIRWTATVPVSVGYSAVQVKVVRP